MSNAGSDEVAKWEGTEGAVWQSVWEVAPPQVVDALAMSTAQHPSLTIYRALKVPSWLFNRIVARLEAPTSRELLDAELERFASAGVQHGVCVPPGSAPPELPQWLEARGLVQTTTLARMVRTTRQLPGTRAEIEIRPVGRERASVFGETVAQGFSMPPICAEWFARLAVREGWRTYLAYVDGTPAGTGALFMSGSVGWLGFGTTLDAHRQRGVHHAMLVRRMVDAADLGCRWLQTETNLAQGDEPMPSLNNIKRVGFEMAYARPNYVSTSPST